MIDALHELRNHLAVATANVEAMRDGVVQPTRKQCEIVLQALTEAEVLISQLVSSTTTGDSGRTH